ncbi:hypothetical protein AX16_006562 [Volvariella volvacea WC 439]|nr:hypothetical protein AX16_006562 [Volvariella volvacea WC 439]
MDAEQHAQRLFYYECIATHFTNELQKKYTQRDLQAAAERLEQNSRSRPFAAAWKVQGYDAQMEQLKELDLIMQKEPTNIDEMYETVSEAWSAITLYMITVVNRLPQNVALEASRRLHELSCRAISIGIDNGGFKYEGTPPIPGRPPGWTNPDVNSAFTTTPMLHFSTSTLPLPSGQPLKAPQDETRSSTLTQEPGVQRSSRLLSPSEITTLLSSFDLFERQFILIQPHDPEKPRWNYIVQGVRVKPNEGRVYYVLFDDMYGEDIEYEEDALKDMLQESEIVDEVDTGPSRL